MSSVGGDSGNSSGSSGNSSGSSSAPTSDANSSGASNYSALFSSVESCFRKPATDAQEQAASMAAGLMSLMKCRQYVHGKTEADIIAQGLLRSVSAAVEQIHSHYTQKVSRFLGVFFILVLGPRAEGARPDAQ